MCVVFAGGYCKEQYEQIMSSWWIQFPVEKCHCTLVPLKLVSLSAIDEPFSEAPKSGTKSIRNDAMQMPGKFLPEKEYDKLHSFLICMCFDVKSIQSTLDFATMGKAANLYLATRNAVTDLF